MSIPMSHIDDLINAAIDRLSCDGGLVHQFYIDLRTYQQRITQQQVDRSINACQSRGLYVSGGGSATWTLTLEYSTDIS